MTAMELTRRGALTGLLGAALGGSGGATAVAAAGQGGLVFGKPQPFSLDLLKDRAAALSREPLRPLTSPYADILERIDYDAFFQIVFRKDDSLWSDGATGAPVQLFHLGRYCKEPCSIGVVESGHGREILYRKAYFAMPAGHVAELLPENIGFAGLRIMAEDQTWDWLSFLGASYFRSPGSGRQYGLSARGLAIDTGLPSGEEFPRFTQFWLEAVPADRGSVIVHALLESASVTGAYRFTCSRTSGVSMDVDLALYPRTAVKRLGVAPLTSMFWYGESDRRLAIDWRPEVHDSDGLAVWTGADERIWRPLNNPHSVMTNSFFDTGPKGFGFLQRDRSFEHYQDDAVFYDRRPSLWVEPLGDWGRGSVQLVEIPTVDEVHDNIVAYWVPEAPVLPGRPVAFSYRLHWRDNEPFPADNGKVAEVFTGIGGSAGEQNRSPDLHRIVVDFKGGKLETFGPDDGVQAVASASRGEVLRRDCYPVRGETELFRAVIDLSAIGSEPVDIRLFLKAGADAITETMLLQYFPSDPRVSHPLQYSGQ